MTPRQTPGPECQVLKECFLGDALLTDFQGPRRWEDRDALREPAGGLGRHVLELERHRIQPVTEAEEGLVILVLAVHVFGDDRGRTLGGGFKDAKVQAERVAGESQHAGELAAAEDS